MMSRQHDAKTAGFLSPRSMVLAFVMAAALSCSLIGPVPRVMAQGASPAASPGVTGCTVAPRSADELLALWYNPQGTPVATPLPASPVASASAVPSGTPADAATVAAITTVAQQAVACVNAGEYDRWFALFTDNVARQFGPDPGTSEADARAFLTTPQPLPAAQRQTLLGLHAARVLPDGRVGAVMEINDPTQKPPRQTAFVVFAQIGGHWLIDEFSPLPAPGTPAA